MQRIVTGAILGALVVAAIVWLPPIVAGIALGVFWLLGVREWADFARLARGATIVYVTVAGFGMLTGTLIVAERSALYVMLAIAALWWLIALAALQRHPRVVSRPLIAAAGFATLLPAWALLAFLHTQAGRGPAWVLTLLAIVWAADVGAYAVGRLWGKTKLAPTVSPGKTWEGVGGGLACAAAAGWLAGRILEVPALELVVVALLTAAGSIVGDLTVSLFKRNAGVKDSGRLLPGHGGVLDRIDSMTAAVAVFVLGLVATGIITRS